MQNFIISMNRIRNYSEGNLMEVKFEDFRSGCDGMTENIYQSLSILDLPKHVLI
jgi:hypothetical protein